MFQEELDLIKNSKQFKPDLYLCSVFMLSEKTQFDFYSKKTKLVTSFAVEGKKVSLLQKNEKVFQKEKQDLEKLDLDSIKIDLKKALELINKLVKDKYPKETLIKKIIILQQNKVPIWNISSITTSLNIINVKINAVNGSIIEEKLEPILSYRK